MYLKFIKRCLDFALALVATMVLSPLLLVMILLGAIIMKGNPFFTQLRPGKDEKIFRLIKFRSMTMGKNEYGELLPDEKRLTKYGEFIRSTSLDELPELFNIIKGDMSIVGPRPQLVRDMLFMTSEQRKRHSVRPGLTGLAQSNGRNGLSWENKLALDLEYIEKITFCGDVKIIFDTVICVFKQEGITEEGMVTAADLGDYLLSIGSIDNETYEKGMEEAQKLLNV